MPKKFKVGERFKYYDFIVYADRGSDSAHTLASNLSCRRWRAGMPDRYSRRPAYFKGYREPIICNWGTTNGPDWASIRPALALSESKGLILNPFDKVRVALNKIDTFKALDAAGVPCVKWTTDKEQVQKWLASKKQHTVFARKTVSGQGGAGISLVQGADAAIPAAPLYTRNFPKTHEFRVHVAFGKVIDFVEKRAILTAPKVDRFVRNHRNGWTFAHQLSRLTGEDKAVLDGVAVSAIKALGLHFGAVDLLAILDTPESGGRLKGAVVCEINTGPGLENTQTISAYKSAFETFRNQVRGK